MMKRHYLAMFFVCIGTILGMGVFFGASGSPSLLPKKIPEGWTLVEGPRTFSKRNLFEHIDGQAELFYKYGFKQSLFAVYRDRKNPDRQIDLDIYDMGNVLHAFGVFSRFRGGNNPGGVGLNSYVDDRSFIFYKGKYFVMLYATEETPSVLKELAEAVSREISDPSPAPREIGLFPRRGLKPESIQYVPEGFLGHQFLKGGFQASYGVEKREFHLFLALFEDPQESKRAWGAYKDYVSKKGREPSRTPPRFGQEAFQGKDPYQGEIIIFLKGRYLVGVMGPEIRGDGEDRLAEFLQNIP
jgi:hypothetical protein